MTTARTLAATVVALLLAVQTLYAQDFSRYRNVQLGGTLASVAAASGVAPAEAKLIHQRPALIQELRWRPLYVSGQGAQADPVREIVFSFYNDELSLIVVDYERQRTEGLTDADLIESISATYGQPVLTGRDPRAAVVPSEPGAMTVVARWADEESSLMLMRGTYPTSLRLVMTSKRLDALARTATREALQQDEQEAPQRELDQEKKRVDDRRISAEKARQANKPAFKP